MRPTTPDHRPEPEQPAPAALPLVSVVTPFYNEARYLRECIESVLAQTWPRFEYILVDNGSTDGSGEIAAEYAKRDERLRMLTNPRCLPQLENFNLALRQISPESTYTKMVGADDWLYPECLERMVRVAELSPSIGLVSSYSLRGRQVEHTGLPYDAVIVSGREVCRRQLLDGDDFCGSPTTVLYRSDHVRAAESFFDTGALHADTERAYRLLAHHDLGFVHQVLSYVRLDNDSISARVRDLDPNGLGKLIVILKYGREFLDPAEFDRCLRRHELRYYRRYVRQALGPNRSRFLAYHRDGLARVGYRFPKTVALRGLLAEMADLVLNPKLAAGRLAVRLGLRARR